MNKSRKRAIQKHRAKEAKFDARRKSSGDQGEGRGKGSVTMAPPARSRTAPRRQAAETAE